MVVDASVADGGVGIRRCWLSAGDLGWSGNTGLFNKIPESRELNRARGSAETGSCAVRNNLNVLIMVWSTGRAYAWSSLSLSPSNPFSPF